MNQLIYDCYLAILKSELVVALGCTEPIAIAYAAAKAREVLGEFPEHCKVSCSGNIVKNVKGVTVPNSGGEKGIVIAATLGIVGGDPAKEMAVLESVTDADRIKAKELASSDFCQCELIEGVENLYIIVELATKAHMARVEIKNYHTNITCIEKDGEILYTNKEEKESVSATPDKTLLNVKDILAFADEVRMEDIEATLSRQIEMNTLLAEEGLRVPYGAQVGQTLLREYPADDVRIKAMAYAAAGSDARMSGCPMGAVINSGSGNQGITVTMPLVKYAEECHASKEKLYRALIVANLIAIHQKRYIGSLSAYCGAVSAACGSASGIAYMLGYDYSVIADQITNTIATIDGMVCDGAKPSCAAKISAAVNAALLGLQLAIDHQSFKSGEGIVKNDVESTIQSVGRMGRVGMKSTDVEILNIMLDH